MITVQQKEMLFMLAVVKYKKIKKECLSTLFLFCNKGKKCYDNIIMKYGRIIT